MEVWKSIKDYSNYEVSNLGRVKSLKYGKERILKIGIDKGGYSIVVLCQKSILKTRTVHQLVAESFLNHIPNGKINVVNHKNFIRTDNRLENLEIITMRENSNKKHLKTSSQYVGVGLYKPNNKWIARIYINGKPKHLGYFINELEASQAYQIAFKNII